MMWRETSADALSAPAKSGAAVAAAVVLTTLLTTLLARVPARVLARVPATVLAAVSTVGLLWTGALQASETRVLIAAGLGGEPAYASAFRQQANELATQSAAFADDVTVLVDEAADSEGLNAALARLADRSADSDRIVVYLIGHGSYDERDYKFNIPGPDITADQLGTALDAIPAERQLLVLATSASGAAQDVLAREGRVVITATRSGGQRNASRFGEFFVAALTDPDADLDKDGRVTPREAFAYAENRLADYFDSEQRIATERPRMEGGDGTGFTLALHTPVQSDDPALAPLRERQQELEGEIAQLRAARADGDDDDDYYQRLQRLLLEMALLQQQIDAGGARTP